MPVPMNALSPPVEVENLQESLRAFKRSRLRAAARKVFYENGFAETSIDQIAQAAGIKRSTLYNHFQDKNEILAEIASEYGEALARIIALLPGPVPTRTEICDWLRQVVAFAAQERTPTVLLSQFGAGPEVPGAISVLGEKILHAFAAGLPAFRHAIDPGPHQGLAGARARLLMHQIGQACMQHIRDPRSGDAETTMIVAAEVLERFIQDETEWAASKLR